MMLEANEYGADQCEMGVDRIFSWWTVTYPVPILGTKPQLISPSGREGTRLSSCSIVKIQADSSWEKDQKLNRGYICDINLKATGPMQK